MEGIWLWIEKLLWRMDKRTTNKWIWDNERRFQHLWRWNTVNVSEDTTFLVRRKKGYARWWHSNTEHELNKAKNNNGGLTTIVTRDLARTRVICLNLSLTNFVRARMTLSTTFANWNYNWEDLASTTMGKSETFYYEWWDRNSVSQR